MNRTFYPSFHDSQALAFPSLQVKIKDYSGHMSDPTVWGPAFWFTLHTGAAHAPEYITDALRPIYWNYLEGVPYWLPCAACQQHAIAFIQEHRPLRDQITSSRRNLFNFTVDFHNRVNQRSGKPLLDYEKAYQMYRGAAAVQVFSAEPSHTPWNVQW